MDTSIRLLNLVQWMLYVLIAPLTLGMSRWIKARLLRRQGPPVWQPYYDLYKLLGKQPVIPQDASWIFSATPIVVFTCYALAGFLVPVVYLPHNIPASGDFLLLVYLLGLAKFVMALAGMDTGAPFGGLGSSRKMFLHALVEPTLVLLTYTLAQRWHTANLWLNFLNMQQNTTQAHFTDAALLLAWLALALVALAETGRLPYDNPNSHLELTMFGKAVHLEYAGANLALIEWAEAMRLTFFFTLLLNFLNPWMLAVPGMNFWLYGLIIAAYPVKLFIFATVLAIWELHSVKIRLRSIIEPATAALLLALMSVVAANLL